MVTLTIIGASGRMGNELIRLISTDSGLKLAGAIEAQGHPALGLDAGTNAGVTNIGVPITDDLAQVTSISDVVIDFSSPKATLKNTKIAVNDHSGVVIGTTGFSNDEKSSIKELARQGGRILLAPNMSIGINLLLLLCQHTAKVLDDEYDVEIVEMHHKNKKDAPSGTAVKLGEVIATAKDLSYSFKALFGRHGIIGERSRNEIGIHSVRGGDVVGDHQVIFAADGERIELIHKASNRSTFAKGALRAAKFIASAEPGLYDMQHVLGLNEI